MYCSVGTYAVIEFSFAQPNNLCRGSRNRKWYCF